MHGSDKGARLASGLEAQLLDHLWRNDGCGSASIKQRQSADC
jgi:hypothetical protein